jgi:hypothetical protein
MDQLTPASVDWALTHVQRFGDTDIFPVPFEMEALAADWAGIKPRLLNVNLESHMPGPVRRALVPKPGGDFRVTVQLDPLDALIYAAAIYEAATPIENSRVSEELRVACSYRVHLDAKGSFFGIESGWRHFHERSKELLAADYSHVFLADISDFYNQIYIHRVQNALEAANVPRERTKNIEEFLLRLNAKQSRGLPVGPIPSILLAEVALNDVDNFLLRKGAPHVRYVDDIRIFCRSRQEAIWLHHDLTEYLYTAHRLSLEAHKTYIAYSERFLREELRDPERQENDAKTERLTALAREFHEATGYVIEPDDLPDDEKAQALRQGLADLFITCVTTRPLHLGLARHLLRRATSLKTAVLIPQVFDALEILAPVFRDVAKYLIRCMPQTVAATRGVELVHFLQQSDVGQLPFIRMWSLEVLLARTKMANANTVMLLAGESPVLGVRYLALAAGAYRQIDWIRGQKETWQNHGPWDRRAIIHAAAVLPRGERRPWLEIVKECGDPVDRAVACHALQES